MPNYHFWQKSSNILIKLVDDFFDMTEEDYFKGNVIKKHRKYDKNRYLEKIRQQEIALANQNPDNPFFIYDIEYAEPYGKKDNVPGRFDMLGVYTENREVKKLFLIELKSTLRACDSKVSGIRGHEKDMKRYLCNNVKINERKKEAVDILKEYIPLFNKNSMFTFPSDIQDIDVGAFFILTDEATTRRHNIKEFKSIILKNGKWEISQELCKSIL